MASLGGKRKGESDGAPAAKKSRAVKAATCDKWIADCDKDLSTRVWLQYERSKSDRSAMEILTCKVCVRFVEKL